MNCHEYADSEKEIEEFIVSVSKSEPDLLYEKKKNFVDKFFSYKSKASENILKDVLETFDLQ